MMSSAQEPIAPVSDNATAANLPDKKSIRETLDAKLPQNNQQVEGKITCENNTAIVSYVWVQQCNHGVRVTAIIYSAHSSGVCYRQGAQGQSYTISLPSIWNETHVSFVLKERLMILRLSLQQPGLNL